MLSGERNLYSVSQNLGEGLQASASPLDFWKNKPEERRK
jgi:hypothetical protein